MKTLTRTTSLLAAISCLGIVGASQATGVRESERPTPFVENVGQWETPAHFVARSGPVTVRLEPEGIWMQVEEQAGEDLVGHVVHLSFENASEAVRLRGEDRLPGHWSYFLGKEAEGRWRTAVAGYGCVVYEEVLSGVDLSVRVLPGRLELGFRAEQEDALEQVRVGVAGTEQLELAAPDRLAIVTSLGTIGLEVVGGAKDGLRRPGLLPSGSVADSFDLFLLADEGSDSVPLNHEKGVPPSLEWSTFLGGFNSELLEDVVVDDQGGITVCGQTASPSFPTTPGPFTTYGGPTWDVYVTRIDPSLPELVYSVLLGGLFDEYLGDLVSGAGGSVYLCGSTNSSNFPTTEGAFKTDHQGLFTDAFVLRLNAQGTELSYSTLLGVDNASDNAAAISVEPGGEATVVGSAGSSLFPVTPGAYDESYKPHYVTRIDPTGSSLVYSTFLGNSGGGGGESFYDMASLGDGRVALCGDSSSFTYPTTRGAFSETNSSLGGMPGINTEDMIVTILAADGGSLEASTYIGGDLNDQARALSIGPMGDVFVAGFGTSSFPTSPGAFQPNLVKTFDAVVARLAPDLGTLIYSTYLGGNQFDNETGWGIDVDASGIATVSGTTNSFDFPVTLGALSEINHAVGSTRDAFVARLSPTGDRLFYSTYLGGSYLEDESRVRAVSHGSVVVAGHTTSPDFPITPDALFGTISGRSGASDGYIARLSMLPTGVRKIGTSAESCLGEVFMGVTKMAQSGDPTFGVTCSGAPPSSGALLSLGFGEFPGGGLVLPEFTYYIDVSKPVLVFLDNSDAAGYAEFDVPLPPGTAGLEFFMQYIWVNTAACGGLGTLSASNALGITVQ